MNPLTRTLAFVVLATVSAGIAVATYSTHRPADLEAFSDVGEAFYPDFSDPNTATGLSVAKYNPETARTEVFSVEFRNGLWRIPSHHGYPADGEEMLARTASSMIGVRRTALGERTTAAHRRYDLLDPLDADVSGTDGRGARITLLKGDQPLVDFIVGKKVEGEQNLYYVRRADEDRFYTADLGSLSISTKFADWIEKNVLNVERSDVSRILINRYFVDEAEGRVKSEGFTQLDREGPGVWKIDDLNPETESVNMSEVNNLLSAIQDLKIVGVRPKPAGLRESLQTDGAIDARARLDLQARGFYIFQGRFIANEGEVHIGTDPGVVYTLAFGEEFSGTDVDIEVGKNAETAADKPEEAGNTEQEATSTDETTGEPEESDDPEKKSSRYLFVSVQFDPELLGPAPEPPVKPTPPEQQPASENTAEAPAGETPAAEPAAEESADAPSDPAAQDPQAEYEKALKSYEEAVEVYEIRKKEYDEKVKKGEERVSELNRRFADWYYVISEDVFDRLKLKREALVEVKEPEVPETTPEDEAATPPATAPEPPANEEMPAAPQTDNTGQPEAPAEQAPQGTPSESSQTPAASEQPPAAETTPAAPEADVAAPETASEQTEAAGQNAAETEPESSPETPEQSGDAAAPEES